MTAIFRHLINNALGTTPLERWDALTQNTPGAGINPWIVLAGIVIIFTLLVLLCITRYRLKHNNPTAIRQRFDEFARSKELTDRQYRLLVQLADNAKLKRAESIFTMPTVFDREAAKMIEIAKTRGQSERVPQLETELAALREKLDFRQYTPLASDTTAEADTHTTRQIPLKKKIYIKRNHRSANGDLQGILIDNTPAGLLILFPSPVEVIFGQNWICRYHAGPFVAEFMTTVAKCSGNKVLLHHSNRVRRINRRKVLRVPIQKPAVVAAFPFKKEAHNIASGHQLRQDARSSELKDDFEIPTFQRAVITELGGPGLRIRTNLNVQLHERILLMFKLQDTVRSNTPYARKNSSEYTFEHIAKVRHIIIDQNGPSIAVELIGLSDSEIDELIRITNEAAIAIKKRPAIRTLQPVARSARQGVTV